MINIQSIQQIHCSWGRCVKGESVVDTKETFVTEYDTFMPLIFLWLKNVI